MQEEVENRTLTLVVSGTKFTGRMFKAAISKYMAHRKEKKLEKQRSRDAPVVPHGKQTVKQLVGQNQGISNIEITENPAFTFRTFLLRLGLIGPEYKNVREHLLANLEGDRAWRYDRSTYECLNRNHRAEDAR